jgi:hypothetical protein
VDAIVIRVMDVPPVAIDVGGEEEEKGAMRTVKDL